MAETDHLSLADLERTGRVWGSGTEKRALCPLCDHPKRDYAHASLALNVETGAWHCHRCGAHGLLEENKTPRDDDPLRSGSRYAKRHRGSRTRKSVPPAPRPPSPVELAEQAEKRATLRRLWSAAVPIDAPAACTGADYLWEARRIPVVVALDARMRFSADWYGRPSLAFPVVNGERRLVAAESRFVDERTPKSMSAGPKSAGVFEAAPGALDAEGVAICEGAITALSLAVCGLPALALCGHAGAPAWFVRRLALHKVFVALDWDEEGAEKAGAVLMRDLAAVGAKPHRLALPAATGDWNDVLVTYGIATMREALGPALGNERTTTGGRR